MVAHIETKSLNGVNARIHVLTQPEAFGLECSIVRFKLSALCWTVSRKILDPAKGADVLFIP